MKVLQTFSLLNDKKATVNIPVLIDCEFMTCNVGLVKGLSFTVCVCLHFNSASFAM